MSDTVVGSEGMTVNKTKLLLLWSSHFDAGKTDNKQESTPLHLGCGRNSRDGSVVGMD